MDQLIINIILAVLAAILLSRLLKGVLRLVAIAIVSLTLILVSAGISNSSSSGPPLFNWLNSTNSPPIVEDPSTSVSSPVLSSSEGGTQASPPGTEQATDSAFSGVSASAGSLQDPDTAPVISGVTPPSSSSDNSTSSGTATTSVDTETDSNSSSTPSSRPINALW